jgi:hypothetical protein
MINKEEENALKKIVVKKFLKFKSTTWFVIVLSTLCGWFMLKLINELSGWLKDVVVLIVVIYILLFVSFIIYASFKQESEINRINHE